MQIFQKCKSNTIPVSNGTKLTTIYREAWKGNLIDYSGASFFAKLICHENRRLKDYWNKNPEEKRAFSFNGNIQEQ